MLYNINIRNEILMKAVSIAHIPIKRIAASLQKFSSKRSVKVKTKFLTWSNERYMIKL